VSIRARFIPTKDELNADSGAVDLSNRDFAELKKTAHAILLDEYDEETKIVTYKDPNYGDLKLQVTHLQFQAMAGDDKVKLRPFFRDGFGKSRLAEVV
jgi:hypothetical protein